MSADPTGLQISIMGREFRVACAPEEQKSLQEAVEYLNRKMQEIKEQGKVNGLDRIAMLRYDIPDIRLLLENDVRFLDQFS